MLVLVFTVGEVGEWVVLVRGVGISRRLYRVRSARQQTAAAATTAVVGLCRIGVDAGFDVGGSAWRLIGLYMRCRFSSDVKSIGRADLVPDRGSTST